MGYSRGPFLAAMFLLVFCFGSHDEAGLLAFEALQGLPRPARGTHGSLKVAACVGQAVVCRASSLHLLLLRQKGQKCP